MTPEERQAARARLDRQEVERLNETWGHITPEWDQPGVNPAYEHNRDLIEAVRTALALYDERDGLTEDVERLREALGIVQCVADLSSEGGGDE